MEDDVDRLAELEMQRHVLVDEEELVAAEVLHVLQRAGVQVVHADDAIALGYEVIAEVRAEEAGPTGDDGRRDRRDGTGALGQGPHGLRGSYSPFTPSNFRA